METAHTYYVQIITEPNEITEALKLRYRVYKKTFPQVITDKNDNGIYESDEFDYRSIHLGLYCQNGTEKKLVGYCRLILPEYCSSVFSSSMVTKHPLYFTGPAQASRPKMTFVERLPEAYQQTVNTFCDSLNNKGAVYAETSRFIIEDEYRNMQLLAFFVSSMFAICESLQIKYSFFTCTRHHVAFYSRYGLTLFPGIEMYDNALFGKEYVIFGTYLDIASKIQSSIKTLQSQLESEKKITYSKAA